MNRLEIHQILTPHQQFQKGHSFRTELLELSHSWLPTRRRAYKLMLSWWTLQKPLAEWATVFSAIGLPITAQDIKRTDQCLDLKLFEEPMPDGCRKGGQIWIHQHEVGSTSVVSAWPLYSLTLINLMTCLTGLLPGQSFGNDTMLSKTVASQQDHKSLQQDLNCFFAAWKGVLSQTFACCVLS